MKRLIEVALSTSLLPGLPPFPPKAFRCIREHITDDVVDARRAIRGLSPDLALAAETRFELLADIEREWRRLAGLGISVILETDSDYPARWLSLGTAKPVSFFAAGRLQIFSEKLVGVVGSRAPSEASVSIARELGNLAKYYGCGIVSGGAKGIDETAVRAALDSDGNAAVICADSMGRFCSENRAALDAGCLTICSQFSPQIRFTVGNAMARNKLIYRSALLTAVVQFKPGSGGTWTGAAQALKGGHDIVAVFESFPQANQLVDRGAICVASVEEFFAQIDSAHSRNLFDAL